MIFSVPIRDRLISVSMDREIKVWDLTIRKPKFGLTSNGGFVYCSAKSAVDPNIMAFGVGDGMFRVWNTSLKPTFVQTIWQGVKEKVTAIAWHPTELRGVFKPESLGSYNKNIWSPSIFGDFRVIR